MPGAMLAVQGDILVVLGDKPVVLGASEASGSAILLSY